MSLVGPRPALFSQVDLIDARSKAGVHLLLPGITGWAQINGRDNLSIEQKVELDRQYLPQKSFWLDLKIMLLTVVRVFRRDDVSH
jgi:O-antigen biosynthesis protein WbqP